MKKLIQFLTIIPILLVLFSVQLCLLKYEHTLYVNLLFVAYIYSLFARLNLMIPITLIVLLDNINFIITGYFGFTIIGITILSKIALKIQNDFYNKLILPMSFISIYCLAQAIIFFYIFNDSAIIKNFLTGTIFNNIILASIWIMSKEPIHD